MRHFVIILLACMGCYTQVTRAENYQLNTVLRIQSCSDFSYITIPPLNAPAITTPPTTPTTPTVPTTTDPATPTTTAPPVPVVPIGGGEGGVSNIRYWRVSWARAINGTSIVSALDASTSAYRLLGFHKVLGLVVKTDQMYSGATITDYEWGFRSFFDTISWTYKYQLRINGGSGTGNNCLCRRGGAWNMTTCDNKDKSVLYNLISG